MGTAGSMRQDTLRHRWTLTRKNLSDSEAATRIEPFMSAIISEKTTV
jgi:hypothetical protein